MKNLQSAQIIALLTPPFNFNLARYQETGVIDENHGYSRKLKISREAAIKSLIEALRISDNNSIRTCICEILGWRKAISAILAIAECLDSDSESLRSEAADSLGDIGSYKAGEPLLEHFVTEKSVMVKTTLALSLGRCRYQPAAKYLRECLAHSDDKLREFSVFALGRIGAKEYLADLQDLAETETDSMVIRHLRIAIDSLKESDSASS